MQYSLSWLTYVSAAKMSKVQWDVDTKMDAVMEISVSHGKRPLLYRENQYKPQQQYSYSLRWLAPSRNANTRQPPDSKLSYKHVIF